jgi:arylsulfatase A-like enzyme
MDAVVRDPGRRWRSTPLDMQGAARRAVRLAGEAAIVGLVAGVPVGLARSWTDLRHGFHASAISITAANAVSGLLWALAAWIAVVIAIHTADRSNRGWRWTVLIALALVGIPVFLRIALWVNVHWLPDFMEPKSLAWNAAMAMAFVALLLALVPLVGIRWRVAGRSDASALWTPWLLVAGLLAVAPLVRATQRDLRPPMFLIVIDALRADHLGCYGYGRSTSPHLDRLCQDGVRFTQAISSGTFTKTSIASLVTGLDPHLHGVYTGNLEDTVGRITSDVLPGELETLAEVLLRGRYRTVAWIEQFQLKSFHGFAQGYMEYHEKQGSVPRITQRVLQWIGERETGGPFFAHLHVVDLHDPYRPKPPYDRLYGFYSDVYRGIDFSEWGKYRKEIRDGRRPLSDDDVEQLRALYDGQIRYIDDELGRFFEQLRRRGLYDRSLIVVTADHGDGFMEHGFISHSTLPYEELVRVPLLMKLPAQRHAGRSVEDQVRLIDVMPTILEVARLDSPRLSGRSLLPSLEGRPIEPTDPAVIEFSDGVALRESAWKYIRLLNGQRELYHLAEDPGERRNLAKEGVGEVARFEARVLEILARRRSLVDRRVPLDASTIEGLKALGYIQ